MTNENINQLARRYNVPVYNGKMIAQLADKAEELCVFNFGYVGSMLYATTVLYATTIVGAIPLCYVPDLDMAYKLCQTLSDYTFGEFRHSKSNHERLERAKQRMEER